MFKRLLILLLLFISIKGGAQTTFFNEVDYKTAAPDQCLEVISPTSEDRTGWNVHIYNGSGLIIESIDLGAIVPSSTVNNHDIIIVDIVLLTDPKGGMVIEDDAGTIVQFLNYSDDLTTITATDGPASGMTSDYIGEQLVAGTSLQLTGTGVEYNDFVWALPGLVNCGLENLGQDLLDPLLPIELIYFKAAKSDAHVLTEWATARENNSFYYLVERSVNGGLFEEIHRQEAAGFSDENLTYSYLDRNPPKGNLYYRLVEVDYDGQMTKSDVVVVQNTKEEGTTTVFPNPVVNELQVSLSETLENISVEVYDLITGKQLIFKQIENPGYNFTLNTDFLASGQYIVRLRSRGFIYEQRVIKIDTK